MPITIQKLTPTLEADYLRFFDDVAFADHAEWSWCYCTFMHMDKQTEEEMQLKMNGNSKAVLRAYAQGMIQSEKMQGYLAFEEGEVVGWCNAGPKASFKRLVEAKELWKEGDDENTLSIVCFIIAPEKRRQGIATQLLARIIIDAKAAGIRYIEAYPKVGEHDCYHNFYGYAQMYRRQGFEPYQALEAYEAEVLRKAL